MMDELIAVVARAAGLSPEQAALAVAAALRFFTARLPSALVGELHARLRVPSVGPGTGGFSIIGTGTGTGTHDD